MPRRAFSTFRAEINDGGPFGASTTASGSVPVPLVSDTSLELLMEYCRNFFAKETDFELGVQFLGTTYVKSRGET